jgi:hypothetical protein
VIAVWASVVLVAFGWSVVLFVLAVADRRRDRQDEAARRQETGAAYAIAGLVMYVLAFADRLPGEPTVLRYPALALPGVHRHDLDYRSSLTALGIITLFYVIRMLIFLQLVPATPEGRAAKEKFLDRLNDVLGPLLAFFTLNLCWTTVLAGVYSASVWIGAGIFVLTLAFFFYRAPEHIKGLLSNLRGVARVVWEQVKKFARNLPVILIEISVFFEQLRPPAPEGSALAKRIESLLRDLEEDKDATSTARRKRLERALERLEARRAIQAEKRATRTAKRTRKREAG